jgi:uncharacterized protein (DUF1810 family)
VTDTLGRFKTAQDDPHDGFATALAELQAGRKRRHWIWYMFPQLAGLGLSPTAQKYELGGIDEAIAYLRDRLLCERLAAVTAAVASHLTRASARSATDGATVSSIMGSEIDARKLVSSMTLFGELARWLSATDPSQPYAALARDAAAILRAAAAEGIPPCAFTTAALGARVRAPAR